MEEGRIIARTPQPRNHPVRLGERRKTVYDALAMEHLEKAQEILDTMLGYLGFVIHVDAEETPDGPSLQIHSQEAELLIGRRGDRLDDIQYLVNRILQIHDKSAPRVRVDVEHYRTMREDGLIDVPLRILLAGNSSKLPLVRSPHACTPLCATLLRCSSLRICSNRRATAASK